MECDVLVAGGGSAGIAAAVAAARLGARTLLVERHGFLGGMAPAALVHSICGLYRLPSGDSEPHPANEGFAREFAARLLASGGASGPELMGRRRGRRRNQRFARRKGFVTCGMTRPAKS